MKSIFLILSAAAMSAALGAPALGAQYRVVPKDCLWNLAKKFCNDPFRWRAIYAANPWIQDPHWIYPGQQLQIPDTETCASVEPEPLPASAPIAASAPVNVPEEPVQPAPPVKEEPPPPPPKAPEAPRKVLSDALPSIRSAEDLSVDMPPAMTPGYPSAVRLKAPAGWRPSGKVIDMDGEAHTVSTGQLIHVLIETKRPLSAGERFTVYRRSGIMESDQDKTAVYLQIIGTIELERRVRGFVYEARILKAGDAPDSSDLVGREIP